MSNIKTIIKRINGKPYNSNIKFDELEAYLKHYGFTLARTKGSHFIYRHSSGEMVEVASHNNKVLAIYVKKVHDLIEKMEEEHENEK